ncbi:cytochrome b/b6 domain-containing protein [Cereibacter sphaeroides]|uniref:cytochrome b/b6 domain-containing protein n=1 Tax=Cereibacter sphaeroides TaxID=1063 RepID=UPI001F21AC59|nr:cytochrome b/b6 domain-containing protein [Cereibacter sphaeroides]MCE6953108.1 cytochrome b/b6 domain-containing protein [Cereibacter sphaeroides]
MALTNTTRSYGAVERSFHWLMAVMILAAVPLGLIANRLPHDTPEALARKVEVFSLHKTLGVAIFGMALLRVLWVLVQPRPAPLHPERRIETALAGAVHGLLYLSLLGVPLAGWVEHAASDGFAPILWPLGQSLPLVPKSAAVAEVAGALHVAFGWSMILAIGLHVAGALKHQLADRDETLARMAWGRAAGPGRAARSAGPALAALALYAAAAGGALALMPASRPETATALAPVASDWVVEEGSLGFTVRQMGSEVGGSFPDWTAAIRFDETPVEGRHGDVTVTIAADSLTLGAVTEQARSAEFLDVAAHPRAVFRAEILPADQGYIARGTLDLRGVEVPVTLPFRLEIEGDLARMEGSTTLDRRDFGIGKSHADEAAVGFGVRVDVALTARRGG